jgi:hypothetical protein
MDSLLRLRDLTSVGQQRGVVQSERLEVRESSERFLSFDGGCEGEGELGELGEHDALEVHAGHGRGGRSDTADEDESS